jgi:fimbrial chaperone protein
MLYGIGAMSLLMPYTASAYAASLRVSPTSLEMVAPETAGVITLTNEGQRPVDVQIRVFRWTQSDGEDHLEPTGDVVVSPPFTSLPANKDYAARVLRLKRQPVAKEEAYRIVVDELPDPSRKRAGTVSLVVRYSIPVFFKSEDASPPQVAWSVVKSKGGLVLTAHNTGDTRLRLADVRLLQGSHFVAGHKGLVGYVLGGASTHWPIQAEKSINPGPVTLKVQSELGPFDANIAITSR